MCLSRGKTLGRRYLGKDGLACRQEGRREPNGMGADATRQRAKPPTLRISGLRDLSRFMEH
jgi:hypothetical protein